MLKTLKSAIVARKLLLVFLINVVWVDSLLATAQRSDRLVLESGTYPLFSNPLEPYFALHPDKKGKNWAGSTALWRRYIAEFEFKDGHLVVSDILVRFNDDELKIVDGMYHEELHSVINEAIPSAKDRNVSWFTGMLIIPKGKLLKYKHMGYASEYEYYALFWIEQGKLIASKNLTSNEYFAYKRKQFELYKATNAYLSYVERIKSLDEKEGISGESNIEDFIFQYDNYSETIYVPFEGH